MWGEIETRGLKLNMLVKLNRLWEYGVWRAKKDFARRTYVGQRAAEKQEGMYI